MSQRGFTLLEVMITSLVMVLLVLAAYPTLNTATNQQELVANMTILETCVVQGIATAKAPTIATTDTIHITFSTATPGCQISEVDDDVTDGQTVTATFTLANPNRYDLSLTPGVPNNEYVVSVRPPYSFTTPTTSLLLIGLISRETPTMYNSIFFNLVTGTVQKRNT